MNATRYQGTSRLPLAQAPPRYSQCQAELDAILADHLDHACDYARYLTRSFDGYARAIELCLNRVSEEFIRFGGGSARAWLFALVRRNCRDIAAPSENPVSAFMSETGLAGATGLLPLGAGGRPVMASDGKQWQHDLSGAHAVIDRIPEPFREIVLLKEVHGLSIAEIAEVVRLHVSAVKARLALGRWLVAEELLAVQSYRTTNQN